MTDQDQIKAISELDGFVEIGEKPHGQDKLRWMGRHKSASWPGEWTDLPLYLTSRDAILPVIGKIEAVQDDLITHLVDILGFSDDWDFSLQQLLMLVTATPRQLSESLLRATNKWTTDP